MARKTNWCFTINNYTDEDFEKLFEKDCKYLVVGKEVGESGTPHLQGFISFPDGKTLNYLKKHIHKTGHFEMAKGSPQQNFEYCSKQGNFKELGNRPMTQAEKGEQGKLAIKERWELAKAGKFEELPPECIKTYEYIHQKFKTYTDLETLNNLWIFGKSGCGKSSYIRKTFSTFYAKPMSKWWDGYNGEEVVVLDDIDPTHTFLSYYLKIWCDHYVFNAEIKGGMLKIRPKIFIITSQYALEDVFLDEKTYEAINRRFQKINLEEINISTNNTDAFQEIYQTPEEL